jgi:hypothetical protein
MGLKSLFFTDAESKEEKPISKQVMPETTTFPGSEPIKTQTYFPTSSTPSAPFQGADNQHLDAVVEMYEKGFDGLNQDGYDFYEFFKAIMNSGGENNPQMYQMAMTMGMAMDKTMTKTKLISQADFYINEINKVYNHYVSSGNSKKQELVNQKNQENQSLSAELTNLRQQLEALTNQIKSKEGQLSMIDNKYQPTINEIDSKLRANDSAKDKILSAITTVKNGINNNLK